MGFEGLIGGQHTPISGKLMLIFGNLEAFDTFDAANHDASRFIHEDVNRVWSDARLAHPISQEAHRASALLPFVQQADWLLDLHSRHEPGRPLLLAGLLPRNLALARKLGTPEHIVVDAGHKEGVRLRYYKRLGTADEANIFSLLIECGFHGDMNSPAVAFNIVARFLRAANCVSADTFRVNWLQPLPAQQTAVQVTHAVVAHSPNLRFTQDRHDLQNIPTKATVVAYDNAIAFATPYNNCTLTMPSLRQLRTGATVARLAQKIP